MPNVERFPAKFCNSTR